MNNQDYAMLEDAIIVSNTIYWYISSANHDLENNIPENLLSEANSFEPVVKPLQFNSEEDAKSYLRILLNTI